MFTRLNPLSYFSAVIFITLQSLICIITTVCAQGLDGSLHWSAGTSQKTFYPGEPVLLTLKIANKGSQDESIFFGGDGIEGFSMEIYDNSNKIVSAGGKIQRSGQSSRVVHRVPAGESTPKSVVLNQWCSTLLRPGQYHVVCHVEYRLRSQATRIPGTEKGFKAGPLHTVELSLDIEVVKTDTSKCKEILDDLARCELRKEGQSFTDWRRDRDLAREMIAFTEWQLAVPYQLRVLSHATSTWLKWDLTNSLARSGTLEAAKGLIDILTENEDHPERIEDIKREIIDAVYRLRETGKPEIVKATDEFVSKYKRPVMAKPID